MNTITKRILVVDNDPVILKMMRKLLEDNGHLVETAEDGLTALSALSHFVPDVVFIDLVMPNISGDRLCKIIKSIPKLENLYIVILSGVALENDVDLMQIGANACIAKGPFNEIAKPILELVGQSELTDSAVPTKSSSTPVAFKIVDGVYSRKISSELLARRNHSEAILNALAEGIIELAADQRIIFVNTAVAVITGIPEEKLLGNQFLDIFEGSAKDQVLGILNQYESKEEPGVSPNASMDPVEINKHKIILNIVAVTDPQADSRVVILNDVTERIEAVTALRKSEKKYRELFEKGSDLLVFHDLEGRLIETNLEFKKEYAWPVMQGKEAFLTDLFDDSFKPQVEGYLERVIRKGSDEGILRAKTRDRKDRFIEYRNVLVYDTHNNPIGVKASGRDITERVIAQRELKLLNEELEQRVIRRTTDLELAKKKAEEANLAKSRFLMNMSHELRTPLNSIISSCDLISSNQSKSDLERIEKVIRSSSKELLQTFERILDISKAKDGKLELESASFRLDNLLSGLPTQFAYKGTIIELDLTIRTLGDEIPNALIGDEKRLAEILFHLTENAAKFSTGKPKAVLTIRVVHASSDDVRYAFALKDDGIGIPEDCGDKIFEAFTQADESDSRQFDGIGIGLSICKLLVALMNGEIYAERNADQGSTFHFTALFKRQTTRIPFDHQIVHAQSRSDRVDNGADVAGRATPEKPSELQRFLPVLQKLAIALENSNPKDIDVCLDELEPYQFVKMPQLLNFIQEYEYDNALATLKEIIDHFVSS